MEGHSPQFICYTAIFGPIRDKLQPVAVQVPGVEFHAYLDDPRQAPAGWIGREAKWKHETKPRLKARRHKLLSHQLYPETEFTLWMDGCLTLVQDPWTLVPRYLSENDLCVFRHMQRNCVYQELEACLRLKKDHPHVMRMQVERYRQSGYPHNNGLGETTAVLRRHTPTLCRFNEAWWDELRNGSVRDQLSFDFLTTTLKVKYSTFSGNRCRSPHFAWRPHR